jgi:hypothetical protein
VRVRAQCAAPRSARQPASARGPLLRPWPIHARRPANPAGVRAAAERAKRRRLGDGGELGSDEDGEGAEGGEALDAAALAGYDSESEQPEEDEADGLVVKLDQRRAGGLLLAAPLGCVCVCGGAGAGAVEWGQRGYGSCTSAGPAVAR